MGHLFKASESDLQTETMHLAPIPLQMTASAATFPNRPVTNTKRDREERKRLPTASASIPQCVANSIISDDSDGSSSDEEHCYRGRHEPSPLCKTKKRRRNRVSFGDVASTTTYQDSDLTQAELREAKHLLWFTKQDRLRSQTECQAVLKAFRLQNADQVTQFSTVYRTSMQVPFSKAASDFLEEAQISVPLTIRGLEWGIAPKLRKRRKEHVRNILAVQTGIRNTELRERFVSSRSLQSSRPARIMARIIGEGDVSSARGITSTALTVKTVPLAVSGAGAQPQHRSRTNTKICPAKGPKLGHARRRRRPLLWRSNRGKGISATHE